IKRDRLTNQPQSILVSFVGRAPSAWKGSVVQVNGVKASSRFALRTVDFRLIKARCDCCDHTGRDLVLQLEDVIQRPVEPISPQMRAGGSLDQLASDAELAAGLPDAAFEDVADA